jgi:hypothetical protein
MIADAIPAINPLMREDFRVIEAMRIPRIVLKIRELRNSRKINPLFK